MRTASWTACLTYALVAALPMLSRAADDAGTGERIYKTQCARCHGSEGQGTKKYPQSLAGERTPAQLTKYIAAEMPEDDPGSCAGTDAERVARYMHDAFYSREARERNKPPRVELARLTVRQYRNALADLIGINRNSTPWGSERGLKGVYYNAPNFKHDKKVLERVDDQLRFDFGTASPLPGKIEPGEFCIQWTGSLLAPETGEYQFVMRSDHSSRLHVNDNRKALIDATVRSIGDNEFTANIYLVAGRPYPLKLEFMKAHQGVRDKVKAPPPTPASVSLLWKIPGRTLEYVPSHCLSPATATESYLTAVPFPPDDRSYGWERGTSISKAWDAATTDAAFDAAEFVVNRANVFANTKDDAPDRAKKLRDFALRFAERAYRRPLDEAQKQLIERAFAASQSPDAALSQCVLLALKSPRFLYREVAGANDAYDVASRLSFGLWDSLPDSELLNAAAQNRLRTREQVAAQAERMLADSRARIKVREFLYHWLKLDQAHEIAKDPKKFPGFDPSSVAALHASLDLFLDEVVWSPESNFKQLLLDDRIYLNDQLASFYGAVLPAEPNFRKVHLPGQPRAGVLTHPYLLATFSYAGETSPIHRGVFLSRGILGIAMRPPPEAVAPLAPDLHPSMTTRERVILQTKPAMCTSCHSVINPLGFTMENYDAVGRFRTVEHGKPVNATGSYLTRSGQTKNFKDVRDLARFLADSDEVHAAFAEQLFHHLIQQSIRAYATDEAEQLRRAFAAKQFSVRKLVVDIMTDAALPPRHMKPPSLRATTAIP